MDPIRGDRRSRAQLQAEIEELRARLAEAEDTLSAIREGEVDAIVVTGSRGEQVFSLSGTEHVYRSIVETMREAAFTVSFDGRVLFCNPRFSVLLNAPQERILGRRLEDLVPPGERPAVASLLARGRDEIVTRRLVFQAAGGPAVPAYISAALLHTSEGESLCVVATDLRELESSARLIQQLRQQQAALQESEHRWAVTLASIADAVIAADDAGRITFMNAVAEGLTGWTRAEAAGRPAREVCRVYNEETRREVKDPLTRALQSVRAVHFPRHSLLLRRDGSKLAISQSSAPIRDEAGCILGAVLVFRDIQARRRGEETLNRALQAAEAASRAKSEFLAHMSHEIRTPLSAIIGLSEVLLPRIQEETSRPLVTLIHESARSMLALLGGILDLARIEAGRLETHPEPFELRGMLETLIEPHRLLARRKGLELSLEMEEGLPERVEGEAELLSRVLQNLLSNAVKYTERGSVRVRVRRRRQAPPGREWIFFAVSDTGIGIPKDSRRHLFESFSRLHGSLTRIRHEGTGLGLAIAKQLVEHLGGEIGVESVEGAGSTFYFWLPFAGCPGPDQGVKEKAAPPGPALQPLAELPPLRVLLAEDNRVNRLFLQSAFDDAGHRLEAVADGRQALESLRSPNGAPPFDLVLMDIQMPVMDGLEALQAIRALEGAAARVPVIALTAFAAEDDERRFREAGADGYVSKPVDFGRLAGEIRRLLLPGDGGAESRPPRRSGGSTRQP